MGAQGLLPVHSALGNTLRNRNSYRGDKKPIDEWTKIISITTALIQNHVLGLITLDMFDYSILFYFVY